ncbi:MAG: opacity protein-like surface antigen [Halocynthiibacter sp.]|jgi:outer membrane immunogenic protein
MTLSTRILAASALAALASTAAFAGNLDPVAPAPVIAAAAPYTAPGTDWTGGYAGVQLGYGKANIGAGNGNGLLYGAQAGYLYDFGSYVIGGEIDFNASRIDLGGGNSLDSLARAKLRAGFDAGPALVYATGGAAFGNATIGGTSYTDTGYFYGVGVDFMVTDRIVVGGEVTQNQFSGFAGSGSNVDATAVALRVSMKF